MTGTIAAKRWITWILDIDNNEVAEELEMQPGSLSDEQLQSLAKEIRDDSVSSETDWLEWKSALDLTQTKARFGVSKQILGMANRDPGLARRNRGGYGYVLVGVEPGAMRGTERFDPAELHDWINPYIGATGPAWQPRYIQVDDTTILAIEVEPPRDRRLVFTPSGRPTTVLMRGRSSSGRTARPTQRSPKTSRTLSSECREPGSACRSGLCR